MSVIISGWDKLPQNCYDCDLHNYHECALTSNSIEDYYNGETREPSCPLKEVPTGKWIPCTEQLPTEFGRYLVAMHTYGDIGFNVDDTELKNMYYGANGWQKPIHSPDWINQKLTQDVLAWMPLPEPYMVEEQQGENT